MTTWRTNIIGKPLTMVSHYIKSWIRNTRRKTRALTLEPLETRCTPVSNINGHVDIPGQLFFFNGDLADNRHLNIPGVQAPGFDSSPLQGGNSETLAEDDSSSRLLGIWVDGPALESYCVHIDSPQLAGPLPDAVPRMQTAVEKITACPDTQSLSIQNVILSEWIYQRNNNGQSRGRTVSYYISAARRQAMQIIIKRVRLRREVPLQDVAAKASRDDQREDTEQVARILSKVSKQSRRLLTMRYIECRPTRRIAERQGVPLRTMQAKLEKALKEARKVAEAMR